MGPVDAMLSILKADAATIAAVGARLFAEVMPEEAGFPSVVLTQVSGAPVHGIRADLTWATARVQVDVFASDKASLLAANAAVKAALARYRGTVGAVVVDDCMLENELMTYESDLDVRRSTLDFIIYYSE